MKKLVRQWKAQPLRTAFGLVLACLGVAWLVLGLTMKLKWAVWLFVPMLCIDLIVVFMDFKAHRIGLAISAISSFIMFASLAILWLFIIPNSEFADLRVWPWINAGILVVVTILAIISMRFSDNNDESDKM